MKIPVQITPSEYRKLSDEELIRRYAELHESNPALYLYEHYAYVIYGVCLKYNKSEAAAKKQVEDIFTQILQQLRTVRVKSFKSWFMTFINNYFNGKKDDWIDPDIDHFGIPEIAYFSNLYDEALEAAIKSLPNDEGRCFELFYGSKKNYDEVAKEAGIPADKVRSLLRSGNRHINEYLKTNYIPNI